ncbi:hypothetical protein XENOCAPTIV_028512, partial [Xenoophorus captivus]
HSRGSPALTFGQMERGDKIISAESLNLQAQICKLLRVFSALAGREIGYKFAALRVIGVLLVEKVSNLRGGL